MSYFVVKKKASSKALRWTISCKLSFILYQRLAIDVDKYVVHLLCNDTFTWRKNLCMPFAMLSPSMCYSSKLEKDIFLQLTYKWIPPIVCFVVQFFPGRLFPGYSLITNNTHYVIGGIILALLQAVFKILFSSNASASMVQVQTGNCWLKRFFDLCFIFFLLKIAFRLFLSSLNLTL